MRLVCASGVFGNALALQGSTRYRWRVRKFIFSGTLLSALFGGITMAKTTKSGPRDWRLILMWISWGLTVAIAVGTVVKEQHDNELTE